MRVQFYISHHDMLQFVYIDSMTAPMMALAIHKHKMGIGMTVFIMCSQGCGGLESEAGAAVVVQIH